MKRGEDIVVLLPPAETFQLAQLTRKAGGRAGELAAVIVRRLLTRELVELVRRRREDYLRKVDDFIARNERPTPGCSVESGNMPRGN